MVTYFALDGITKNYTVSDLVEGYTSEVTDAFNKMGSSSTLKGNLMLDTTVTPVLNLWKGPTADRTYTLFTGLGAW
jgi:hypothetical protein